MAEEILKKQKYTYALNSNLVQSGQNRDEGDSQLRKRNRENNNDGKRIAAENIPSGEAETLIGKKIMSFGDKVIKQKHSDFLKEQNNKSNEPQNSKNDLKQLFGGKGDAKIKGLDFNKTQNFLANNLTLANVNLASIQAQQNLIYKPSSKETQIHYEQIMYIIQRTLGDSSIEILRDAVDEVINILKDENLNDSQRKKQIDSLLSVGVFSDQQKHSENSKIQAQIISDDQFNTLTVLGQCLTDYEQAKEQSQIVGSQINQSNSLYDNFKNNEVAIELDDEEGFENKKITLQGFSGNEDFVNIIEESDNQSQKSLKEEQQEVMEIEEQNFFIEVNKDDELNQNKEDKLLEITDISENWLKDQLKIYFKKESNQQIEDIENEILNLLKLKLEKQKAEDSEQDLVNLTHQIQNIFSSKQYSDGEEIYELVQILAKYNMTIYYGIKISEAIRLSDYEYRAILIKELASTQQGRILSLQLNLSQKPKQIEVEEQQQKQDGKADIMKEIKEVDLNLLKFQLGSRLMANQKCRLPKGSTRTNKAGYEEVYVPPLPRKAMEDDEKLIKISSLPRWAQKAFPENLKELNRIQSRVYKTAFQSPENLLVCAPTGAGKTNIAMLAILQVLSEMKVEDKNFEIKSFKIIYIAPMKALVTEVTGNFSQRLEPFGMKVKELTGDSHLSRQQISEASLIVTTPEKWDIITRKSGERADFIDLVKLVIIDEIHLLHDSRGPVLESIIARTIRRVEQTQELVRIVALSATLPNYQDVAALLRVDPGSGLFYFDNSYRPVPLEQLYIGVTEKKQIKKLMLMNEICYEKVMERIKERHQILIFVHSRKETARTGKILRDMAISQNRLEEIISEDSESKKILNEVVLEQKLVTSHDLKELLTTGIGIHHAGLTKEDRNLVEDLFAAGHLRILVSTATLAWGVNLPAHTVIIKGTQIYNPEVGKWVELSSQDILQMMGRAGRPQYDRQGEGIIITNHSELQYYLSMNNQQLPIESQMIHSLPDQLNAEVVLGSVSSLKEAINWLSYTYLYIRMRRNPELYGVGATQNQAINLHDDQQESAQNELLSDPTLIKMRLNLAHSAFLKLHRAAMVKYDRKNGLIQSTALGRVAAYYYVRNDSMMTFNKEMHPNMGNIDIFKLFALSSEFQNIPIRENEKIELHKFIERVPIPVKGSIDEPSTKINILLQAYISRFQLEGFDLNADLVYVSQNAARIMRAFFEIAIKKQWASLAENFLNCCKMVERRQWYCASPLRQFGVILEQSQVQKERQLASDIYEVARRIEKKDMFKFGDLADFSAQQLGELVKYPKMGKMIKDYVNKFPRLTIQAYLQPLTRSKVRIELEITNHESFQWDRRFHGGQEAFWIFVTDGDSENILHYEQFFLRQSHLNIEHSLSMVVPIFDPLPPHYFIKVLSDRWLQAEHTVPISFKNLILPEKFAPLNRMPNLPLRKVNELNFQEGELIYRTFGTNFYGQKNTSLLENSTIEFSPIQSLAFDALYNSDRDLLFGIPVSTVESQGLFELAVLRELQKDDCGKIVYLFPSSSHSTQLFSKIEQRLGQKHEESLGLIVNILDEEQYDYQSQQFAKEVQKFEECEILVSSVQKWEYLSRNWRKNNLIDKVSLFLINNIHFIGEAQNYEFSQSLSPAGTCDGSTFEVVIGRIREQQNQKKKQGQKIRIVATSTPLSTSKDMCEWLDIPFSTSIDLNKASCFNFPPSTRAQCPSAGPLQVNIHTVDTVQRNLRISQMLKLMINNLVNNIQDSKLFSKSKQTINGQIKGGIIFSFDKKTCEKLAIEFLNHAIAVELNEIVNNQQIEGSSEIIDQISDDTLQEALYMGVGWLHSQMSGNEVQFILDLCRKGAIKVLFASFEMSWILTATEIHSSNIIIVDPMIKKEMAQRDPDHENFYNLEETELLEEENYELLNPSTFLQIQSLARDPIENSQYLQSKKQLSKMYVLAFTPLKTQLSSMISEPLAIESRIAENLQEHLKNELELNPDFGGQEGVEYLSRMYLMNRIVRNPNYYEIGGKGGVVDQEIIRDYVCELVEDTLANIQSQ